MNLQEQKIRSLIPFDSIKDDVLGESYELSLVFIGKDKSHELNKTYREKDKPTNVLSFPLSETSGEIFIDLETADEEKSNFDMKLEEFVLYLFIHGLLHLKGMEHGATMEARERSLLHLWRSNLSLV